MTEVPLVPLEETYPDSFIIMIGEGKDRVHIPMERTTITGCAVCAFLRKIAPYVRTSNIINVMHSLEQPEYVPPSILHTQWSDIVF
jgi:hypothetical protein